MSIAYLETVIKILIILISPNIKLAFLHLDYELLKLKLGIGTNNSSTDSLLVARHWIGITFMKIAYAMYDMLPIPIKSKEDFAKGQSRQILNRS